MSTLKNSFAPFDAALAAAFEANIVAAITEDVGTGDVTGLLVPAQERVKAQVVVREQAVLCGAPWFEGVMTEIDGGITIDWKYAEGDLMAADSVVCTIEAPARALLTAERPALNFLQLLSGVATATRRYVDVIAGHPRRPSWTRARPCRACAWRRSTRCAWAAARTSAWRCTTASSSRKTTSPRPAASAPAMRAALALNAGVSIQIEVESIAELQEALAAGATSVLLDNFSLETMREAVGLNAGRAILEASGGVNLDTVRAIAETGVDRISIGSLTKDVKAIDYSLRIIG